jgi:hypothetical protein
VKLLLPAKKAGQLVGQFPRRSTLLKGIEPGARIQVDVTQARIYPPLSQTPAWAPRVGRPLSLS